MYFQKNRPINKKIERRNPDESVKMTDSMVNGNVIYIFYEFLTQLLSEIRKNRIIIMFNLKFRNFKKTQLNITINYFIKQHTHTNTHPNNKKDLKQLV